MRRVYGRLREVLRWPNRELDALALAEVDEIFDHWAEEPPVEWVVRHRLGWRPREPERSPAPPQEVTELEFQALVRESQAVGNIITSKARSLNFPG